MCKVVCAGRPIWFRPLKLTFSNNNRGPGQCIYTLHMQVKSEFLQLLLKNKLNRLHSYRYGAFPLHGTVRFGTARYGTVRLSSGRFAFPPQFSTAIEWAGLFTRRYNCAASTAVTSS